MGLKWWRIQDSCAGIGEGRWEEEKEGRKTINEYEWDCAAGREEAGESSEATGSLVVDGGQGPI